MDPALLGGVVAALVVAGGTAGAFGWGRSRRRTRDREAAAALERLEQEAGTALVRTDERVRLAGDELDFAVAELGEAEAAGLSAAVREARERLREAFHLHQLLHDHVPDTDEQRRDWFARIVALCRAADEAVAEQVRAVAARRADVRRAPSAVEHVRRELERVRGDVAKARATLGRLAERYTDEALLPVADNPTQAERLLEFAGRSADLATARLGEQRVAEADGAARAAADTVRRADGLLRAVEEFEVEALRAESALGAMIAESRAELATARALPAHQRAGAVDAAVAALEEALADLPRPGERADPVASLTRVRRANTALDDAVADQLERVQRERHARAQLGPALDDAERQIATARSVVDDYRAPVGPDARTRLAEAEGELARARGEQDPERALATARRAATLAAEAATTARRDIARAGQRYPGGTWGDPRGPRGGGSGALGAVLGGMVLGGILEDLGDIGDMFG
ncbi:hypothetical protein [Isoptericola variabilis]|uniref:Uncharacterized protein n=1 Tax=Isoptericola variabilis (strain 225) TaxID=743718 RepID=F6FUE7_ISOV2|nr:hypothetical protein [Isoptericola variabilis]AEG44275.1 hypothetical protein Isova_1518 [Isoptericola variabilis 225]